MKAIEVRQSGSQPLLALLLSTLVSLSLLIARVLAAHNGRYWFLAWNVLLAWLPLLFVLALRRHLMKHRWWNWQNIGLTLLWLAFLPNSFYLISDLVHIHSSGEVSVLYDVALFTSFALNGLYLGFASLYLMHRLWLARFKAPLAHWLVGAVLLMSSFAIYLGRYLRWNSWDVLVNPAGIAVDVSDRLLNPVAHPQAAITTITFFALLGSMYVVIWQFAALRPKS